MARDIKSRRLKPGVSSPSGMRLDCVAIEAIAKNQIVYVDSVNAVVGISSKALGTEVKRKVGVATNATKAKAHTELLIALHAASSGQRVICCPIGVLKNLDTSGGAKGDPVFLGTAGLPTLTSTSGFQRRIGTISIVGVSGTGAVSFNPAFVNETARTVLVGTAAASAASVTVTDPFGIGASITGSPAFATCATVSGVITVTACTWSGNNLVITFSASFTGNVNYQIWV